MWWLEEYKLALPQHWWWTSCPVPELVCTSSMCGQEAITNVQITEFAGSSQHTDCEYNNYCALDSLPLCSGTCKAISVPITSKKKSPSSHPFPYLRTEMLMGSKDQNSISIWHCTKDRWVLNPWLPADSCIAITCYMDRNNYRLMRLLESQQLGSKDSHICSTFYETCERSDHCLW